MGDCSMSKKPCKDHLGNEFESITAMCEHYGYVWGFYYRDYIRVEVLRMLLKLQYMVGERSNGYQARA